MGKFDDDGLYRSSRNLRSYSDRRNVNNLAWYYEEPFGLTVVQQFGEMIVIPLSQIRDYLDRLKTKDEG